MRAYTGTPEIGRVPRWFVSDFTPGMDFAAVSAAAAWLAFSTVPQSCTLPSVTVTLTRAVSSSCLARSVFTSSLRSCRSDLGDYPGAAWFPMLLLNLCRT